MTRTQHSECVQKKAVALIGHRQKPRHMYGYVEKAGHSQAMAHGFIPRKGGSGGVGHVKHW